MPGGNAVDNVDTNMNKKSPYLISLWIKEEKQRRVNHSFSSVVSVVNKVCMRCQRRRKEQHIEQPGKSGTQGRFPDEEKLA